MTVQIQFRPNRTAAVALAGGVVVLALAACSSSTKTADAAVGTTGAAATTAAADSSAASGSLAGVCPSTVKIQTSWYPEAEKGVLYQLVGAQGVVDKSKGTFSAQIKGVTFSVLAGGPYLGNQSTVARMYQDTSVLLGEVSTDDAIELSNKQPVVGVVAPLQKSPKALIYDPTKYDFSSVADVGKSGATILKAGADASTDLLVANGSITKSQLDYSYDGSPSRFITSGGKDILVDYATQDPYKYEHDIAQWKKPLKSLLLADSGYTSYENALSVTPANLTKYADCLKAVVPMIQQAAVDYAADPGPVNAAMIAYATSVKSPTVLSTGLNDYSDQVMKSTGILANGADGVASSFDLDRVSKLITSMGPVASSQNIKLKSGLTAADVVTDQFLDPSIKIAG